MIKQSAIWADSYSMPAPIEAEKLVRLSGLSEQRKRDAWQTITRDNPALARLLRDPGLKAIMEMFDADLFVDANILPELPVEALKGRLTSTD